MFNQGYDYYVGETTRYLTPYCETQCNLRGKFHGNSTTTIRRVQFRSLLKTTKPSLNFGCSRNN